MTWPHAEFSARSPLHMSHPPLICERNVPGNVKRQIIISVVVLCRLWDLLPVLRKRLGNAVADLFLGASRYSLTRGVWGPHRFLRIVFSWCGKRDDVLRFLTSPSNRICVKLSLNASSSWSMSCFRAILEGMLKSYWAIHYIGRVIALASKYAVMEEK